jgi:HPt (histidine-containing phosphotransfer) domain-containing protein
MVPSTRRISGSSSTTTPVADATAPPHDALGTAKVGELVAQLPEHAGPHRERLFGAQALGDLASVRAAAHTLSEIAASLGLTALSELTGAIEEACLEGQADRVAALCERLNPSMDAALARLRALQF